MHRQTIEVHDSDFKTILLIPVGCVYHVPPPHLSITRLVLCKNFDSRSPETSCMMASSCKFVHADLNKVGHEVQRQSIHVNYAWRQEDDVTYDRLPKGEMLQVTAPNSRPPTELVASERVLLTKGSASRHTHRGPLSHCAHYYFNRMCNRGDRCHFIHAVYIDPAAGDFQRAPPRAGATYQQPRPQRPSRSRRNSTASSSNCSNNQHDIPSSCESENLDIPSDSGNDSETMQAPMPPMQLAPSLLSCPMRTNSAPVLHHLSNPNRGEQQPQQQLQQQQQQMVHHQERTQKMSISRSCSSCGTDEEEDDQSNSFPTPNRAVDLSKSQNPPQHHALQALHQPRTPTQLKTRQSTTPLPTTPQQHNIVVGQLDEAALMGGRTTPMGRTTPLPTGKIEGSSTGTTPLSRYRHNPYSLSEVTISDSLDA